MHRLVGRALVFTALLSLMGSAPAAAISVNTTPESQSHNHGVASSWSLNWGGNDPFDVLFQYGDGYFVGWTNTNATNKSKSHTYFPCNDTTFQQRLEVNDDATAYAIDLTEAFENGGNPC